MRLRNLAARHFGNRSTWLAAVLAALIVLLGARLGDLAGPSPLNAEGERQWFAWARNGADCAALFAPIAAELAPGRRILLLVGQHAGSLSWWRAMAAYYLPRQEIAAVVRNGEAPAVPADVAVVRVNRAGARLVGS